MKIKALTQILPNKDNSLNITKFTGCLITWILALICTFVFVQYAFIKLIGAKDKGPQGPQVPQKDQGQVASTF